MGLASALHVFPADLRGLGPRSGGHDAGLAAPERRGEPVTVTVDAARGLIPGTADAATVLIALGWIAGIVAVFATLAIWTYRRRE